MKPTDEFWAGLGMAAVILAVGGALALIAWAAHG